MEVLKNNNGACLLIHGFTGGPFEVYPLAEHLQRLGYNVSIPTLAGHQDNLKHLGKVNYMDWINSAEQALVALLSDHSHVNIIGFSMGGLIGVYLAQKHQINTLSLLSSPIYVGNPKIIMRNVFEECSNRQFQLVHKYIDNIKSTPLKAVINFNIILAKTKPLLGNIQVPVLVLQGLNDDVVHPKSAHYIFNHLQTEQKQLHFLPQSNHILCCDKEREQVFDLVANFLNEYC